MNILEVRTLTKYFGGVAALKGVSFEIEEKKIHGFIGPNGAGKTTLFSLITGAVRPSGGEIHLRAETDTDGPPRHHESPIAREWFPVGSSHAK